MQIHSSVNSDRQRGRRAPGWLGKSILGVVGLAGFLASIAEIAQVLDGREPGPESPPAAIPNEPTATTGAHRSIESGTVEASRRYPISGSWELRTLVTRCTYRPYDGLRSVYRLNLIEGRDGRVTGRGELWSEAGVEVTGRNHLIMDLDGHFDGTTLRLNYTIAGRERTSTGALAFLLYDETSYSWDGVFDSSIAASSGPAQLVPR